MTEEESAITYVRVFIGDDEQGYYTAMYANHEDGPRSEAYEGATPAIAKRNAAAAARRDFPGVPLQIED